MRIACTNHHRQLAGGTEAYLDAVIAELARRGHEVSLWHEAPVAAGAATIHAREASSDWSALVRWRPDILFNHGLAVPAREAGLADIAPVVHFAHNYHGTCISGEKTRKFPSPRPCARCFGWRCIVQYFPRRCGGVSPVNLVRDYRKQSARLAAMRRARSLIVASRAIEAEYRRHGFPNIHRAPLFASAALASPAPIGPVWRILYAGRMTAIKGGSFLARAVPLAAKLLDRPIELTFAGDGPARQQWQRLAPEARFTGWIGREELARLASTQHLFAMPSLWPEPFGLAGLESGLPVAAYPVGGIPDWLADGVNGHLAAMGSPTVEGLARAIAACLSSETHYVALCQGAREAAGRFTLEQHVDSILPILEEAAR